MACTKPTICFDCCHAYGGSICCWINRHVPVDGWEAEYTVKKYRDMGLIRLTETYRVISCPLFKKGRIMLKAKEAGLYG